MKLTLIAAALAAALGVYMIVRKKGDAAAAPTENKTEIKPTAPTVPAPTAPAQNLPRGLRNNNPLNIRYSSANKWEGQTGSDGAFCKFSSMYYGLRAAGRLLKTYREKYKADTIAEIIPRWAPASENNTAGYIQFVVMKTGIDKNKILSNGDYPILANAMVVMENGRNPLTMTEISKGILAGLSA